MAETDARVKIGIWGPKTAGKTLYIWSFGYLLSTLQSLHDRGWKTKPEDEQTAEQLDMFTRFIRGSQPILPPHTSQETLFRFLLSGYGRLPRGRLAARVEFRDIPGELVDLPGRHRYYTELASCQAIMCFIASSLPNGALPDGYTDPKAYYYVILKRLFDRLKQEPEAQAPKVMAFIVTKIDHDPAVWDLRFQREALFERVLGNDNINLIKDYCRDSRYWKVFPCSSVGVTPEKGRFVSNLKAVPNPVNPQVDQFLIRNFDDTFSRRPFGVVEPVIWVLEQLKFQRLLGLLRLPQQVRVAAPVDEAAQG